MRKHGICIVVVLVALIMLASCSEGLAGSYTSESGRFTIEFRNDGTCTWYQLEPLYDDVTEIFFEGTYEKEDDL